MEYHLNKRSVSQRRNALDTASEQSVDFDLTLPDYCPDIERILSCTLDPNIYIANVSGDLADILELTLKEGDSVIFTGTARELENSVSAVGVSPLVVMEKRTLTLTFYYPPQSGNEGMECSLSFDLCVEAVQTKNNPDKAFS